MSVHAGLAATIPKTAPGAAPVQSRINYKPMLENILGGRMDQLPERLRTAVSDLYRAAAERGLERETRAALQDMRDINNDFILNHITRMTGELKAGTLAREDIQAGRAMMRENPEGADSVFATIGNSIRTLGEGRWRSMTADQRGMFVRTSMRLSSSQCPNDIQTTMQAELGKGTFDAIPQAMEARLGMDAQAMLVRDIMYQPMAPAGANSEVQAVATGAPLTNAWPASAMLNDPLVCGVALAPIPRAGLTVSPQYLKSWGSASLWSLMKIMEYRRILGEMQPAYPVRSSGFSQSHYSFDLDLQRKAQALLSRRSSAEIPDDKCNLQKPRVTVGVTQLRPRAAPGAGASSKRARELITRVRISKQSAAKGKLPAPSSAQSPRIRAKGQVAAKPRKKPDLAKHLPARKQDKKKAALGQAKKQEAKKARPVKDAKPKQLEKSRVQVKNPLVRRSRGVVAPKEKPGAQREKTKLLARDGRVEKLSAKKTIASPDRRKRLSAIHWLLLRDFFFSRKPKRARGQSRRNVGPRATG